MIEAIQKSVALASLAPLLDDPAIATLADEYSLVGDDFEQFQYCEDEFVLLADIVKTAVYSFIEQIEDLNTEDLTEQQIYKKYMEVLVP